MSIKIVIKIFNIIEWMKSTLLIMMLLMYISFSFLIKVKILKQECLECLSKHKHRSSEWMLCFGTKLVLSVYRWMEWLLCNIMLGLGVTRRFREPVNLATQWHRNATCPSPPPGEYCIISRIFRFMILNIESAFLSLGIKWEWKWDNTGLLQHS